MPILHYVMQNDIILLNNLESTRSSFALSLLDEAVHFVFNEFSQFHTLISFK